jgi:hypothetical protein
VSDFRPRSEQIPTDEPDRNACDAAATDPGRDRPDAQSGDPRTERQLRILDELTEMGMVLTRATYAEALRVSNDNPAHQGSVPAWPAFRRRSPPRNSPNRRAGVRCDPTGLGATP